MARLFVAVWPSDQVVAALAALDRPQVPGLRWSSADQWHVTLRFLGSVDDVDGVVDAVAGALDGHRPVEAVLGPATARLGRSILHVPVAGLDDVAASVAAATAAIGAPPEDRPFVGHLTLARAKGRLPRSVVGVSLSGAWTVADVVVVRSETRPEGARYTDVARIPLDTARPPPSVL